MTFLELTGVLGNLGEFVGSIVVLATLIYLAVQVQQSKELLEENRRIGLSQAYAARTEARVVNQRFAAGNPFIAPIAAKTAIGGLAELTEEERFRYRSFHNTITLQTDNLLYQVELGFGDGIDFDEVVDRYNRLMPIWKELGVVIPPRVQEHYQLFLKSDTQFS
ncbi:MAG: hypothetical protein KUG79_03160 [Pseudomonadales bacterium]|nr:hypothetical protein [Pseudomonadales bacterium]